MKTLKSQLKDRQLRFDGVSEIEPDQLARFLLLGIPPSKLRISADTPEMDEFNAQVSEADQLKLAVDEAVNLDMAWQLPEKYQKLDLEEYMATAFESYCPASYTPEQIELAIDRISFELHEVEARGMVEFMQTVIYIIDQLRKHDIVWGVGRGSSCASYLMFLIGLHVVDCVTMDVSPLEFFHE